MVNYIGYIFCFILIYNDEDCDYDNNDDESDDNDSSWWCVQVLMNPWLRFVQLVISENTDHCNWED